jgi:hypothetical protein
MSVSWKSGGMVVVLSSLQALLLHMAPFFGGVKIGIQDATHGRQESFDGAPHCVYDKIIAAQYTLCAYCTKIARQSAVL